MVVQPVLMRTRAMGVLIPLITMTILVIPVLIVIALIVQVVGTAFVILVKPDMELFLMSAQLAQAIAMPVMVTLLSASHAKSDMDLTRTPSVKPVLTAVMNAMLIPLSVILAI